MRVSRRSLIAAASAAPLARLTPAAADGAAPLALPDRDFCAPTDVTYLDSGSQHPISVAGRKAIDTYLAKRELDPANAAYNLPEDEVRAKFAKLVNAASPDEIAFVQSTTTGEQMVLRGLGLPQPGAHIVTDTLHFFGSLPLYEEMARQGCDVSWVKDRDGRISLDDMKRAIRPGTKLIALSLVSTINGFEHDLKAVCDLAHANGALVYADIIHAAGCVPIDVQASGVDFAACASYKWLMGDFGLGFLYAREELLGRVIDRSQYGYYQAASMATHILPFDSPGTDPLTFEWNKSATGYFEVGSQANAALAALSKSLPYLRKLGVANIEAHRQPLLRRLEQEMPRLGFQPVTPPGSKSALITFAVRSTAPYLKRLKQANMNVRVGETFIRLSPSVYNDMSDIERFLEAVKPA